MATTVKPTMMSVGQFIDQFVMTSDIPGAVDWFNQSIEKLATIWSHFRGFGATQNTIGSILEGIARRISLYLAKTPAEDRAPIAKNGKAFIAQLCFLANENVAEDDAGTSPDLDPDRFIIIFDH